MSNKKKKPEFYTLQVEPEQNSYDSDDKVDSFKNPKIKIDPESVGFRLDPRVYDSLRDKVKKRHKNNVNKVEEVVEPTTKDQEYIDNVNPEPQYVDDSIPEQTEEEIEPNDFDSEEDYDEISKAADQYDESTDEVVIEDVDPVEDIIINNEEPIQPIAPEPVKVEPEPATLVSENEKLNKPKKKKQKYVAPPYDLLIKNPGEEDKSKELAEGQKKIIDTILKNNNIKAHVDHYVLGPTVIEHLISIDSPAEDVRKIKSCEPNLLLFLKVPTVRILIPVPGMAFVGIEIPKENEYKTKVYARDLISSKEFRNSKLNIPVAVGKDNFNKNIYIDIDLMPHALIAGASRSGKSVCLNLFIMSLIYKFDPSSLRLVLIDPKTVEFKAYHDIPHLACPVITEKELLEPTLQFLVDEMERRFKLLDQYGCRNLEKLNETLVDLKQDKVPYIIMIMDEFNDFFLDASDEVENCMSRLTAKARAAGIHIILATQRPSADVIKGTIKANVTTRLAFKVSSQQESIIILGQAGAEKLEGFGDLILRHSGMEDTRLQGGYVDDDEAKGVAQFLRDHNEVDYILTLEELKQKYASRKEATNTVTSDLGRNDPLFKEVAYFVVENNNASVNQLQRLYKTGFNRMDAIFRDLTELGIVTAAVQGARREVLVDISQLEKILAQAGI